MCCPFGQVAVNVIFRQKRLISRVAPVLFSCSQVLCRPAGRSSHPCRTRANLCRITDVLDAINDHFGKKTMVLAREGFAGEWRLRANHCSPRYITGISELATVRV